MTISYYQDFCLLVLTSLLWLSFKINTAHAQNQCFHFFCFEYINVPMIILNEHMHLNMVDVYKKKQEYHSGNVLIIWTSSRNQHQEKSSPTEIRFSAESSMRFFSPTK